MQQYAEEAVKEHLGGYLQPAFFKEKKGSKRAPFSSDLTDKEIQKIMTRAMLNSDRGKKPEKPGNVNQPDPTRNSRKPVPMKVFSWQGEIDTIMSPLDSIRYYKHFLRTGFMAMDPVYGKCKSLCRRN